MFNEIRECNFTKGKEIVLTPLLIYFQKEDYIKDINDQIRDIRNAIQKFLRKKDGIFIYPFTEVDPSCKDFLSLIKSRMVPASLAKQGDFIGVKIYPPLNCDLEDSSTVENINAFFKYCAENSIPITTHCSGGGCISKNINSRKAKSFSSPLKWKNFLSNFSGLKINFAHFGDFEDNWIENITSLMRGTKSEIHADISYSLIKKDLLTKKDSKN